MILSIPRPFFSPKSTGSLRLQLAPFPRAQDLEIFVSTTTTTRALRAHTLCAPRALHLHYHGTWTYAVDDLYLYMYEGSRAHEQQVHT